MHCLLQRLQEKLTAFPPVELYTPVPRPGGGEVIVAPGYVKKEVVPALDRHKFQSLYESIVGSRYLIQLQGKISSTCKGSVLLLHPSGDLYARPSVLKDLENAAHDMLHGLVDLHKEGYTHRDLRWENCIKVNILGEWKWVITDLEGAGLNAEEWKGDGFVNWDEGTLEDRNGKKAYPKGSDVYQLGKLLVE